MRLLTGRTATATVMAILAAGLSAGCTPLRGHQGYVADPDLVNSVQVGVDTRASVAKVLGKPTLTSQFDDSEWLYVSRDTRNFAYNKPKVKAQLVLHITFDKAGVVSNVRRTGIEQVASVRPYGRTTPTLGRHRSFFEDLFGNIGSVGAGAGPGGGPGGGGGGQP